MCLFAGILLALGAVVLSADEGTPAKGKKTAAVTITDAVPVRPVEPISIETRVSDIEQKIEAVERSQRSQGDRLRDLSRALDDLDRRIYR